MTRQLNNPLTVILGYASLLDETEELSSQAHKAIEAILNEARHMRLTLESLARMSRPQADQIAAISVTELLTDLEQLHRSEFVHRSIDFRVHIAPALPRVPSATHNRSARPSSIASNSLWMQSKNSIPPTRKPFVSKPSPRRTT